MTDKHHVTARPTSHRTSTGIMATNVPVTPETPITIKITINENHKKVKLPLKDLGASVLLDKVCLLLL